MKIYSDQLPATLTPGIRPWSIATSLIDPVVMVLCYMLAVVLVEPNFTHADLMAGLVVGIVSYPGLIPFRRMTRDMVPHIVMSWAIPAVGLLLLGFVVQLIFPEEPPLLNSRIAFVWSVCALVALLLIHSLSPHLAPYLRQFYRQKNVMIVGVNDVALRLTRLIASGEAGGQHLVGYVDDRDRSRIIAGEQFNVLGTFDELGELTKKHEVGIIYMSMPMLSVPRVRSLLAQLRDTTASVYFVPDVFVQDIIQGRVASVGGLPMLSVCETPFTGLAAAAKRAVDLGVSLMLLPLLLPLLGVIAILIKATSKGPAIYKQRRCGLDGQEIVVLKFRTMVVMEDGQTTYSQVTRGDGRVTPIGRILRRTSLDELPQIFNVLGGSMSLVGPRPHALAVNEQCRKTFSGYMVRHKVKPGITGWAQVNGFRGGDDVESMRRRTECDLEYLRSWTLALDLMILWKTALMLVRGDKNAY